MQRRRSGHGCATSVQRSARPHKAGASEVSRRSHVVQLSGCWAAWVNGSRASCSRRRSWSTLCAGLTRTDRCRASWRRRAQVSRLWTWRYHWTRRMQTWRPYARAPTASPPSSPSCVGATTCAATASCRTRAGVNGRGRWRRLLGRWRSSQRRGIARSHFWARTSTHTQTRPRPTTSRRRRRCATVSSQWCRRQRRAHASRDCSSSWRVRCETCGLAAPAEHAVSFAYASHARARMACALG